MKNIIFKINENITKESLIKATPYVFICYFVLLLFPYIFAPVSNLYSFFLRTPINLGLRGLALILIVCFSLLVYLKFKPGIEKKYFIFCLILIVILLLSLLISPKSYSSIITHEPYHYETLVFYRIGFISLFSGFISCISDMIFGFLFIFIFPHVCNKQNLKPFLMFVFIFIVLECLFSIVFEFKKYISTLSGGDSAYGGYEINISGSFISKNQFGSFLVIGYIAGFLSLKWYFNDQRVMKILLIFCLILIGGVTVLSLCKTAIVSLVLFSIPLIFAGIRQTIKNKKYFAFAIAISAVLLIIAAIVFVILKPNNQFTFLNRIQNGIRTLFINSFSEAKESRYIAWFLSISTLLNYHMVIGYPKGSLQYVLKIGTNGYATFPHNGFIQQVLCYGLFGLFVLFYLYSFIFKRIHYLNKKEKALWIALLLSVFIFMMTETEVVLMSGSLLTFGFSVILSSLPNIQKSKIMENYDEVTI